MLTQSTPSPHDAILSVSNHGPDTAALRMGNWKLIVNAASQKSAQPEGKGPRSKKGQTKYEPVALYDLSSDPSETTNLASAQPDRVNEMQARLQTFLKDAVPMGERP